MRPIHKSTLAALLAMATTAAVLAVSLTACGPSDDSKEVEAAVSRFVSGLQNRDAGSAASATDNPVLAQQAIGQMFDGLSPRDAEFSVDQADSLDSTHGIFAVRFHWDFGNGRAWDYSTTGSVNKLSIGWKISWTSGVLAPGMSTNMTARYAKTYPRGPLVLDRGNQVLMAQQDINVVRLDPASMPDIGGTTSALATVLEVVAPLVTADVLRQRLNEAPGKQVTAVSLRDGDFAVLEPELRAIPGLAFAKEPKLVVDDRRVSSPAVEELRNFWQQSQDEHSGWALQLVRPDGSFTQVVAEQGPAGADIPSTIDKPLQLAAEDAVVSVGEPAAMVVMQPSTGAVLAVAQNNQADAQGPIAFAGEYAPGSAFAPVLAAALMSEGKADVNTPVQCTDGPLPLHAAFAGSCYAGVLKLAEGLPDAAIRTAAERLGLSRGLSIPGLSASTDINRDGSGAGKPLNVGGGPSELAMSPFAMALLASSVARGGPVAPMLVNGAPAGADREAGGLPGPVLDQLRAMMQESVATGTASDLNRHAGLIGKAGTADVDGAKHGWFYGTVGDVAVAVFVDGVGTADPALSIAGQFLSSMGKYEGEKR